jgi:hypothetical protein
MKPLLGLRRCWLVAALGAALVVGVGACGSTGVTAAPLQASISRTFANLYVLQQVDQGNPRPSPRRLAARAQCQKGIPADPQSGAGSDWSCQVTFLVAGPATPVTALYNVSVQTDGCYAADGDGPASVNGSRTITGPGYRQIVNPLWLIDSCFDVS